ncbi:MAG: hypothetical protein IPJ26_13725 [Bacteroidetes bacterium]|nr:hypothetical protein [Bacteroidota bacterium]
MNETITLNHLVLYLYNETELTESVMVQKAIDQNEEIAEEFYSMAAARDLIDHSLMHASKSSINSILSYATLTAPLHKKAIA